MKGLVRLGVEIDTRDIESLFFNIKANFKNISNDAVLYAAARSRKRLIRDLEAGKAGNTRAPKKSILSTSSVSSIFTKSNTRVSTKTGKFDQTLYPDYNVDFGT